MPGERPSFRTFLSDRLLGRTVIEEMASRHDAGAGAIDLAVKKAMEANLKSARDFRSIVEMLLEAHQTLLNAGENRIDKNGIEKSYSVKGLNIEGDLHSMIGGLERLDQHLRQGKQKGVMNMNLLFYGPPGSGKSELARFLAKHLDREVLWRRVSDLQSHYVGYRKRSRKLFPRPKPARPS